MSVYVCYVAPKRYRKLTFEDLISGKVIKSHEDLRIGSKSSTRTDHYNYVPYVLANKVPVNEMISELAKFNEAHKDLHDVRNRHSLYRTFYIKKKSGNGLRKICAPNLPLKNALTELRMLLQAMMSWEATPGLKLSDHHTAAFAYIEGRCTKDAIIPHQQWCSEKFLKLDFHDFFGSVTLDFLMHVFSRIFPLSCIVMDVKGQAELKRALSLCFLDGGLPQGTPISPWLTNVMMIPFDYHVSNKLRSFPMGEEYTERFVYTRYADDIFISCRVDFDYRIIENYINETLEWMSAPFRLNSDKTHYGSRAGKNYILGIKLNKDNELSVGHREKKYFEAMVTSFVLNQLNINSNDPKAKRWSLHDIQVLRGLYSYYRSIERKRIDEIVSDHNRKYSTNFVRMMRDAEKAYYT